MSDPKPLILCEPSSVQAASIAVGYDVAAIPANGGFDSNDFADRRVILWPDETAESRLAFRKFAEKLNNICAEINIVMPNGKPHGWNIQAAISRDKMTWPELAAWAKSSMMAFERGTFPRIQVETIEAPDDVPASVEAMWDELGIARNKAGVINNVDNIVRVLAGWKPFKDIIWFDDFYLRYFTTQGALAGKHREWQDIDDINLTVLLQREFGFPKINQQTVSAAVQCRGHQCHRNEPKEWLRKQKWDGSPRVDRFFSDYFGAEFGPYTAAVSRNFWVGMIARIYQPGCQLDNMVILEGKQGIFKSKALEAIGGKWYMEAAEEITSKDFFVALAGKLIVEIADLDSFSRADTNRIKKVITCRTDRYRQPYARATQDHPRQSIFVGTTNEQHYLRDSTGARRFWPIICANIDLDRIRQDREQLFAEAVVRYIAGEDWYKVPQELTQAEQESRRDYDEWENIVQEYSIGKVEINLMELAASMGFDKSKIDKNSQRRLGTILRHMGWERRTVRRGLTTPKLWFPASDQHLAAVQAQPEPSTA